MRAFLVLLMEVARNGYRLVVRNKLERTSDLHLRSTNLRDDILKMWPRICHSSTWSSAKLSCSPQQKPKSLQWLSGPAWLASSCLPSIPHLFLLLPTANYDNFFPSPWKSQASPAPGPSYCLFSQIPAWLTLSPPLSLLDMLLLGEACPDPSFQICKTLLLSFHTPKALGPFDFVLSERLSPFNLLYTFIIFLSLFF